MVVVCSEIVDSGNMTEMVLVSIWHVAAVVNPFSRSQRRGYARF